MESTVEAIVRVRANAQEHKKAAKIVQGHVHLSFDTSEQLSGKPSTNKQNAYSRFLWYRAYDS